uniref:AAA+ ATPase domain-containing protein n=1 Tax=Pyramimonas obovata TaxID=1411642 RepID=A0A7S0WNV3_9CHLO|mmetsp:Transcript_32638/g.71310  ORF Transcript_32638/g.71310 Transcript_32638/m.71310 type:complete len:540 (+) Transcript_32638:90-1709(+)|eukprot:CAMPEP_0118931398 /NCGR_PEP_ID=MMETSP1169-20130426/7755_1 /TAXON_ID=36882 /ORGANISM="Pyramimonas obovata, Strain CCMP722" /LENGTH=539 /DNA_ID=CAMNT_0006873897 /DNA_START=36 /DNA_END=1655 /DNA_ORIENTATION=-
MTRSARAARQLASVICRQMHPQVNAGQVPLALHDSITHGVRTGAPGQHLRVANTRLLHTTLPVHQEAAGEAKEVATSADSVESLENLVESIEEEPSMTPAKVVEALDRYIVGQPEAKRAVAIALRNRWRRHKVPSPLKEEIVPKNILMIGPTGCGKTEIARRLAKLADAPFIKVEATKFTEVGFHGRDVDQIIRDLVDAAIVLTRQKLRTRMQAQIQEAVENKILDLLTGEEARKDTRETFRDLFRKGELDDRVVEIELPERRGNLFDSGSHSMPLNELVIKVDKMFGKQRAGEKRSMKVSEARPYIEELEQERLINQDTVAREAILAVESDGIVFIDEIDKIVSSSESRHGADASSEGVQRDLLPIIEGSMVSTKYGNVNTDHILFVCSGAFHSCKPSDMLAELQGRLPIRVNLKGLTREDLYRILTEPESNMLVQQQALLSTEGLDVHFTDAAIKEIAAVAADVNRTVDNIGARRLHTIIERIMDPISFSAPDTVAEHARSKEGKDGAKCQVVVDKEEVTERVSSLLDKADLSKFVL